MSTTLRRIHEQRGLLLVLAIAFAGLVAVWAAPVLVQGAHYWDGGCVDPYCDTFPADEAAASAACAADGGSFSSIYVPSGCEGMGCFGGGGYYRCDLPHTPTCATNPTMDGCSCTKANACNSTSGTYAGGVCTAPDPAPCCVSNMGDSCNTNACGVAGGTVQCNGSCSGAVPAVVDQCPGDAGLQCSSGECSSCTPDASCAASTCSGSTCSDSCGNVYAGTQTGGSCSACTPDASCAANTCSGSTCSDSCGNVYAGTKTDGICDAGGGGPVPSVSCSPSSQTVASGGSATFTATPADGAGPTYTWLDGSNNVLGTGSPYSRTFTASGNVRVRASDGSGGYVYSGYCAVTVSGGACSNAGPVTITATPSRVQPGGDITLSWDGSNVGAASCTVTNLNTGATVGNSTVNSCSVSGSASISDLQSQTTYRLTCGSLTKDVTINVVPRFEEF